jgi:hypothetical protein
MGLLDHLKDLDLSPRPGCCPDCGSSSAKCVVGNYWSCNNHRCKNFTPPKKKAPPVKEEPRTARYVCTVCAARADYLVESVAGGLRCAFVSFTLGHGIVVSVDPCNGLLVMEP